MPLCGAQTILSVLKWCMHLGRVRTPFGRVHKLTWSSMGSWALVQVWACSKSSLGVTNSKLFLIDRTSIVIGTRDPRYW